MLWERIHSLVISEQTDINSRWEMHCWLYPACGTWKTIMPCMDTSTADCLLLQHHHTYLFPNVNYVCCTHALHIISIPLKILDILFRFLMVWKFGLLKKMNIFSAKVFLYTCNWEAKRKTETVQSSSNQYHYSLKMPFLHWQCSPGLTFAHVFSHFR